MATVTKVNQQVCRWGTPVAEPVAPTYIVTSPREVGLAAARVVGGRSGLGLPDRPSLDLSHLEAPS